jgi:hypothetical protein
MSKPIKTLFKDQVVKQHSKSPSGGDCFYADSPLDIPLVIGDSMGHRADLLDEIGTK